MTNRCDDCKFFLIEAGAIQGVCRRFPPRPTVFDDKGRSRIAHVWTAIQPDDWCGEHKPKIILQS